MARARSGPVSARVRRRRLTKAAEAAEASAALVVPAVVPCVREQRRLRLVRLEVEALQLGHAEAALALPARRVLDQGVHVGAYDAHPAEPLPDGLLIAEIQAGGPG